MKPSNNLENKTPLDNYWGVELVSKKVQAHSFLEPPLEYNTRRLWQIKVRYCLFNHLRSYRNFTQFKISSRKENR